MTHRNQNAGKGEDDLVELAKIQIDRFNKTRDIEFVVNIPIWTISVLSISFFYKV